jgi:hypothetical protein
MKQIRIRNILGGLSLTSALFVFQACYGTPQDMRADVLLEGQVKAKSSGLPIDGIKVSVPDFANFQLTDTDGKFSFYTGPRGRMTVQFEDVDSAKNGSFAAKDSLITSYEDRVYLNVALEEK